jgi:hypothetical protein
MPTCSQYPSSSAQNHRQHTRARHLPRLRNRTRAALRTEPLHQRYNPIHDNPPACSLTTIQPCPVPSRRHHCALPLYTTLTHLPAPLTTQRMASWTSTAANTAHPHTHHDPNSVIPPYPTTPTPGQSAYATPHHYPPQPQPQPQPQQSYFPAPIPRQVQAQTQMQPQPQTQTHVQPYPQNPPVLYQNRNSSGNGNPMPSPYQPAYHDGADGYYYNDNDDKCDSLRGYEKERTKGGRGRDKDRALERRPTMGESVMAAVGRVGRVLGGERR